MHTVLAQFPDSAVQVSTISNVRFESQVDSAIERTRQSKATLVHTMVDSGLRAYLKDQAEQHGVQAIDLMGPLLEQLSQALGQPALGQPGLYRKLNKAYFDRVAAIEYTLAHDDGQRPEGWLEAEVVLLGVSRVGKTPLSLYLSVLGWKAANYPVVSGIEPPAEIFQINPKRVIGLTVEAGQLLAFRQQRQQRLGVVGTSDYTNPEKIFLELEEARRLYKRGGFHTIHVTDKPIESTADDVIRWISKISTI